MPILEWNDSHRTGDAGVDHEHKKLIELLNSLFDTMAEGPPQTPTRDRLGDVYASIAAHFALEETLMRKLGYDEYGPHKEDHEDLLEDIRDIMDAYEMGLFADNKETFGIKLCHWFGTHFRSRDARLHGLLSASQSENDLT
jgi:hemerythrin